MLALARFKHTGESVARFSRNCKPLLGKALFPFFAALLTNTWVVEGWFPPARVAGRSMAPTLRGAHWNVVCQHCSFRGAVGKEAISVSSLICPLCSRTGALKAESSRPGDWLIADRIQPLFRKLKRFDTVLLKDPERAHGIVVKRIIALPGEVIDSSSPARSLLARVCVVPRRKVDQSPPNLAAVEEPSPTGFYPTPTTTGEEREELQSLLADWPRIPLTTRISPASNSGDKRQPIAQRSQGLFQVPLPHLTDLNGWPVQTVPFNLGLHESRKPALVAGFSIALLPPYSSANPHTWNPRVAWRNGNEIFVLCSQSHNHVSFWGLASWERTGVSPSSVEAQNIRFFHLTDKAFSNPKRLEDTVHFTVLGLLPSPSDANDPIDGPTAGNSSPHGLQTYMQWTVGFCRTSPLLSLDRPEERQSSATEDRDLHFVDLLRRLEEEEWADLPAFPAFWVVRPTEKSPELKFTEGTRHSVSVFRLVDWPLSLEQIRPSPFSTTGQPLAESQGESLQSHPSPASPVYRLAEDEYFVVGDNAEFSRDSRIWPTGTIRQSQILGIARKLPW